MMSPLTVAQLLPGGKERFDLVIFDEASQLPAEDAVGSVMRGKQLVVVGDPKQLPPTNFFAIAQGTVSAALDSDGMPIVDDAESILEEYMGAGVPMSRLKWHYRSAHESLIAFSNVQFYEKDLYTFPSVETNNDVYGLQFEYLPNGAYEGKGLNAIEARRVADEVVRFAKEQLEKRAAGEPTESLGVGTFNLRQQLAILDELELRRRDDPSIEPFFDRGVGEPFFVKNLENIQGDERDVIFISVTYAKGTDGRLRLHFGPLNGENGWRRLNVLTTRARQRMRVFSSMRGDEINTAATTSRGAHLLREFLLFAERGRLESVSASLSADTESPFEAEVVAELTSRGVKVVPQVGVAGYRMDIGVLDDDVPGRFVCGIECDGVAYHASETARDRDRLRQQVLEARGWTIVRVWSTDWFKDRAGQVERLLRSIEQARLRGREEQEQLRQARTHAREEAARRAAEEAEAISRQAAESGESEKPYERPEAREYKFAAGNGRYAKSDLLAAPLSQLVQAVETVVRQESPVHELDVMTRVAGMWDTRLGSRIQSRLRDALSAAASDGRVRVKSGFCWGHSDSCIVRSRAGSRIPAERIAPEEYQAAILEVLAGGHGFARPQLITEVRSVLGFSRTGASLDEAINAAIDVLLGTGQLGEGSIGIRRRVTS
jgi:very-short-patch-repair endonuclease